MPFVVEALENRILLSGLTPTQVRAAYRFDQLTLVDQSGVTWLGSGRGETIAIVDAYTSPTIVSDLMTFDAMYALPNTDSNAKFVLTVSDPFGTPPANATWQQETTMDVEWAHAIAPKAHILLVQALSSNFSDLFAAVDYARKQQGVAVVSMSWEGAEYAGETSEDSIFTTPAGHRPVTFVAATGDNGTGAVYPASSPNVISVGGTTLTVTAQGTYVSETTWSDGGGGHSTIEGTITPTVSYDADPNTGFDIYDSTPLNGKSGLLVDAGTSGGTPQWAGLFAIADQARAYAGRSALDGRSQVLPALASFPESDFHDITTGTNGIAATVGYDEATGYGTPIATKLIPALATYGAAAPSAAIVASVVSSRVFSAGPVIAAAIAVNTTETQKANLFGDQTAAKLLDSGS